MILRPWGRRPRWTSVVGSDAGGTSPSVTRPTADLQLRFSTGSSRIRENSDSGLVAVPRETTPNSHEFDDAQPQRPRTDPAILPVLLSEEIPQRMKESTDSRPGFIHRRHANALRPASRHRTFPCPKLACPLHFCFSDLAASPRTADDARTQSKWHGVARSYCRFRNAYPIRSNTTSGKLVGLILGGMLGQTFLVGLKWMSHRFGRMTDDELLAELHDANAGAGRDDISVFR
jgi:hypothetical protein